MRQSAKTCQLYRMNVYMWQSAKTCQLYRMSVYMRQSAKTCQLYRMSVYTRQVCNASEYKNVQHGITPRNNITPLTIKMKPTRCTKAQTHRICFPLNYTVSHEVHHLTQHKQTDSGQGDHYGFKSNLIFLLPSLNPSWPTLNIHDTTINTGNGDMSKLWCDVNLLCFGITRTHARTPTPAHNAPIQKFKMDLG